VALNKELFVQVLCPQVEVECGDAVFFWTEVNQKSVEKPLGARQESTPNSNHNFSYGTRPELNPGEGFHNCTIPAPTFVLMLNHQVCTRIMIGWLFML